MPLCLYTTTDYQTFIATATELERQRAAPLLDAGWRTGFDVLLIYDNMFAGLAREDIDCLYAVRALLCVG